jgi:hypothetical protein
LTPKLMLFIFPCPGFVSKLTPVLCEQVTAMGSRKGGDPSEANEPFCVVPQ